MHRYCLLGSSHPNTKPNRRTCAEHACLIAGIYLVPGGDTKAGDKRLNWNTGPGQPDHLDDGRVQG